MPAEHPFANFVRILGKGPNMSRPLSEAEMYDAALMLMRAEVEPIQLGAFLCLLRINGETLGELIGMSRAACETRPSPEAFPRADLDWPTYAGKKRRLPYYVLAALALTGEGFRIGMHGLEGHTEGRIWTSEALALFGIAPSASTDAATASMAQHNLAWMALPDIHPALADLMSHKHLLGLRSPVHTVVRHLNPFDAPAQIIGVAHPPYRALHRDTALALGPLRSLTIKGDGGEAERVGEKACEVAACLNGVAEDLTWAPLLANPRRNNAEADLALPHLRDLWRGTREDEAGEAALVGTIALALFALGEAADQVQAETRAASIWQSRRRERADAGPL
jgi:anthranilate phosphoribosyltransferase